MNWPNKLAVRILIAIYGISNLLQNGAFIDRKKVYAAENPSTTNIIAVFVDKDTYQGIQSDIQRYTTEYIQQKIGNSKAIVFPIDTKKVKAQEISQILENMYFEWLKDSSSKLIGTILIGDVPLPVVQNNGFVYPSIYPYVDFENQQFIYDASKKFFVANGNINGQAEIRHGIIKFDTTSQYDDFFAKVKSYYENPTTFIDKAIRYEDYIWLKKYFIPENTKYYINSFLFWEDIAYHRFNNLLLNQLTNEHNKAALDVENSLQTDLQNVEDPDLQTYAADMKTRNDTAASVSQEITSFMPTLTLKKSTQEMLKGYDGLISAQFLTKIKDNVASLARRYKTTENEIFTEYSSLTDKILQKDNRILGDLDNNVQPLLVQMNDYLESGLNTKIDQEKYYMTIPIPLSELDFQGKKRWTIRKKCTRERYDYFENYLFGNNANLVTNAQQASIYRGTFQNLTSIAGQKVPISWQSVGASYKIFSAQTEANRWYDFNNTIEEIQRYDKYKTNKQSLRKMVCSKYFLWRKWLNICLRPRQRTVDDSKTQNKCVIGNTSLQWGCETFTWFSNRMRWWASPLNLDATTQKLNNYDYKNAVLPIYSIAWSKKIDVVQPDANTYKGLMTYTNLIQEKFGARDIQNSSSIQTLITSPLSDGSDLVFPNQFPAGNLESPTWQYTTPKTYAQTNFFSLFNSMPMRIIQWGKAIIYRVLPGECGGYGSIYTYKTIDSRVKNISPTRDQISDIELYKFKDPSDIYKFYTSVMSNLSLTKADILKKNDEFSGTDSLDITGVVNNLTQVKLAVASWNNGMQQIISFNPSTLSSYLQTGILQLAQTRSWANLNLKKIAEMQSRITNINDGLESLLSYVNFANIDTIGAVFSGIIQSENLKGQKVEILNTRKTNIIQNLDYVNANMNILKTSFINARNIYTSIGKLNNNIVQIQNMRTAINGSVACLPTVCGCDASHYKVLCDVLDSVINTLKTNITVINTGIAQIGLYSWYDSDIGSVVTVTPFVELEQTFAVGSLAIQIQAIKMVLNTFSGSNDPEKKEKNKGMNLTTQDRPIDNIRNITFQGVGWDSVRLNYPNLYEVWVFKKVNDKLILKGTGEIKEAIKLYLTNKAKEYNILLDAQNKKKSQYYQTYAKQFTFLGQLDSIANPNTHNYSLLPTDYFINQLGGFLDTLAQSPKYGEKAIYGDSPSATIDDKLAIVAKMLYYQNIWRQERSYQTAVDQDMTAIKSSFDINHKISQVTKTYLTDGNDQWGFITPLYNRTGYEVGYINSDGQDYISANPTPAFIQQIQSAQETTTTVVPQEPEDSSQADLQAEVDSCEWVDANGTALIFDFKTFNSPRAKAMACRLKNELKVRIQVSFKNSLGPVIGSNEMMQTIAQTTGQWKAYGKQRDPKYNYDFINQYAVVNIDKTIISVDSTGTLQLKIGLIKDLGNLDVKIRWTGDNCFSIQSKGKVITSNICTQKGQIAFNPYAQQSTFDIVMTDKKAGITALIIELCPPGSTNACIGKQQIITAMPWPLASIKIQSPDIVMEGSQIPLIVNALDSHQNNIGISTQAYTISVQSGDGKIYDGSSENSSIKFFDFARAWFFYQAPTWISSDKQITIKVTPDLTWYATGTSTVANKTVQKKITVIKGVITVVQNNVVLYQSSNAAATPSKVTYNLPKYETDVQYKDADGYLQVNPQNIPSLVITVKDKSGKPLDTVVNIVSKQGIVLPGTVTQKTMARGATTKTITTFRKGSDFIVSWGKLSITLYPSFKAGSDIIAISIPWSVPINIPVLVNPWLAKTVLVKLNKKRMDLTTTKNSTWSINVVDMRNNKVTKATTIKLWVIWPASSNVAEFSYSGTEYIYTVTANATGAGGEGYVFAYIKDRQIADQSPWYERFIIQESLLPKEKLNIMYLSLFWTDRWNQRWYFSENNKAINTMTDKSKKLLATTTELVDPSKIKQIEFIIDPHAQIQTIMDKTSSIIIENKELIVLMPEVAKIHVGNASSYQIQKIADTWSLKGFGKNANRILYIPEPTDSIITGNIATNQKITINWSDVIDLSKGTMDARISIDADNESIEDMNTYTMTMNGKTIGKLLIRSTNDITTKPANIDVMDPVTYGKTNIFTEGSTNTQGIGIYINASAFTKQWFLSIEDSTDALLGIGFTNDFKNVSNFANGKSVGDATKPYGSQFLINFWDPLLQRRDKNTVIPNSEYDASAGQTIFADPNKTIFRVVPIDANKDGLKDLLVIYTDGVIKLLKNYWGTEGYKDLQEMMIIAQAIKDVRVGDVDGNGYEDIIIITANNKWRIYLNENGIFAVDGKNLCLNANAEPNTENINPDDLSSVRQFFTQDMDKDGKMDIVTNDSYGDIKVFYGGSTSKGANYVSTMTGICDTGRYDRQKSSYQTVKRYGITAGVIQQDNSLVHRKGIPIPMEGVQEEVDVEAPDPWTNMTKEQMKKLKDETLNKVKSIMTGNTDMIETWSERASFTDNPLESVPVYEALTQDQIKYLPINVSNTSVSIYKEYTDIDGGILKDGDEVTITTTILSKKNGNKLTYIDQQKWPRKIVKDDENKIPSFLFTAGKTWLLIMQRNPTQGYQFMIDNILLNAGESLSFSYTAKYTDQQLISISVKDEDLKPKSISKDGYPDIIVNASDACQKYRWIFFNKKRSYQQVDDDIQKELDDYTSWALAMQQSGLNSLISQLSGIDGLSGLSALPSMIDMEWWRPGNLLSSMIDEGGSSININFIDNATAKVSKKIDSTLEGMCQGFTVGGKWCQWVPVPFNQAFLAPGEYHVFGCVPKLPNPLYPVFKTLNSTIGKGMPLLNIPGNRPSPFGYLPIPWIFGYPFKWVSDGFFLGVPGGPYSSFFRLYLVPTLTLGMGMAMCFGPYSMGIKLPKPFRDIAGNCIVFALPPLTTCGWGTTGAKAEPQMDTYTQSMAAAATQWACNAPAKITKTIVKTAGWGQMEVNTASSPFKMVAANAGFVSYVSAVPQGDFGWLISLDVEPINEKYDSTQETFNGYKLEKWETINLKIIGAKSQGIIKCVVQDWMTRQIQYIQNNLTKMTIQVDLPDLSTVFEWFDKIGNLSETYKAITAAEKSAGYIQNLTGAGGILSNTWAGNLSDKLTKKGLRNLSQKIGRNPFEAIQDIFKQVPLVNIDSRDVNIKVPALTSDDINRYVNYLKLWIEKNQYTVDQRGDALSGTLASAENIKITENMTRTINAVKANIIALEKYKDFPSQLYERTHINDRYLTEISALLSDFVLGINNFFTVNAARYSSYVDAIILIVGTIKTWQAIIDFSVNRSEKCSKCSNDSYGSYSCSLSFLCPKLPIFPIPPFKIPNIYLDLSHMELGMNILLPKINFVPIKIPLPQLPDIPEPPSIAVNIKTITFPTIPVIPEPPTLPEPPSFIPSIKLDLPVLPPAPKIPKIMPEIKAILKVANFIGKIFCIVKSSIGLVGEKWIKAKVEQITQRTWNVPLFDFFNMTAKYKNPPLQWFDYKLDAYTMLKFSFDGVYEVFATIAQSVNSFVSKNVEQPIQKSINQATDTLQNNQATDMLNSIPNLNININPSGYLPNTWNETAGMIDYATAYNELKQGLTLFTNSTQTDKKMNDRVKTITATIEHKATVQPATKQLQEVEQAAKNIIDKKIQENKDIQEKIKDYGTFIKDIEDNQTVLVDEKSESVSLKAPLLTIDTPTKNVLDNQEDPTKTYLDLNKRMVQGYLDAVNNDGPEKLNMTETTYTQSKKYLETTKENIDTALLAYNDQPILAQTQGTCTNCSTSAQKNYSTDISAYVKGVFVETYSGNKKYMTNTVSSTKLTEKVEEKYQTDTDLNNDSLPDILMYDGNSIYIKYAKQESENFTQGGNSLIKHYSTFYSYEIQSIEQLMNATDTYGFLTIDDISIKVIDINREAKNFKTEGATFDNLSLGRTNSSILGEQADGYIIRLSYRVDAKDIPSSFRKNLFWTSEKPEYILVLPEGTQYTWANISIDSSMEEVSIANQLWDSILGIEYYNSNQKDISVILKNLPRKRIYTSLATLTAAGSPSQIVYKKTSPRSNQTVAGMQNLWDNRPPMGEMALQRNMTKEIISTWLDHEWYINTSYTLKWIWTDDVIVARMIIQKDGQTIIDQDNASPSGTIALWWLFFTWASKQSYDFIAIDQNDNITKEKVTLTIKVPGIEVIDVKKSWPTTAEIIAKISNDLDEWTIIFQRLRNGLWKDIAWSNQSSNGGFDLSPKKTIITWGVFTMGNDIGLYDSNGKELATIDPKTGQIKISQGMETSVNTSLNFSTHIPVVQLNNAVNNTVLFQIILPIVSITDIQMDQGAAGYTKALLEGSAFGAFNGGYCIKNTSNDCILYANNSWAIYIPWIYASSLAGTYTFDTATNKTSYIVKDQAGQIIATLVLQIKSSQ